MQLNRILPVLFMSILVFCSFSPAPALRQPTKCDFVLQNNTSYTLSSAVFTTSVQTLIYTNFAPNTTTTGTLEYELSGDNFTYIVTFSSRPSQTVTVTVDFDHVLNTQVVPAGATAFTFTVPGPLPSGAVKVFVDQI